MTMKYLGIFLTVFLVAGMLPAAEPVLPAWQEKSSFAALAETTSDKYPDADAVLVSDSIRTIYEEDGTYVSLDEAVEKILTERGVRGHRVLQETYSARYERHSFTLVQILKKDGTVLPVNLEKAMQVGTDDSDMQENIYDPMDKVVTVNLSGLEVGDAVRYIIRRECFKPRVPRSFSDYQTLEGGMPILSYDVEINAPASLPLRKHQVFDAIGNGVSFEEKRTADGRIVYRWSVKDVPQLLPEPNMPKAYSCGQRFLVSTHPDWETVSRWYWNLCLPHLKATPAMAEKVAELTASCKNEREKIWAIFQFVSRDIRYMGETTETEAPGYEPHDASATFEKRHGVCRDKAALLVALLRQAGFDAYPVLIMVGPRWRKEVPIPYFNHAITAIRREDGWQLMDSTNENSADLLPSYLDDMSYLVATPEGVTLQVSPVAPAEKNMLRVISSASYQVDGTLNGFANLDFSGINDVAYRSFFAKKTEEERRNFLTRLVGRAVPGGILTSFRIFPENVRESTEPLSVNITYRSDAWQNRDALAVLPVPEFGKHIGYLHFLLDDLSLEKRRFPLQLDSTCGIKEQITVTLPVECPPPVDMPFRMTGKTETFAWECQAKREGRTVTCWNSAAIQACYIAPEEYGRIRESLQKWQDAGARKILLPPWPAGNMSNANLHRENVSMQLRFHSEKEWENTISTRVHVLRYAGKKSIAEISLPYFPAYQKVEFLSARVITDGKAHECSPQDVKLLPSAQNGRAPRYPEMVTAVLNLPAVEVGSTVEYSWRISSRGVPFSDKLALATQDVVDAMTVEVTHPEKMPFPVQAHASIMLKDQKGFSLENLESQFHRNGDGTVTRRWTVRHLAQLPGDDGCPTTELLAPFLSFPAKNTWKELTTEWTAAMKKMAALPRQNLPPALGEELTKLREMAPMAQAVELRQFLFRNVRTVSLSPMDMPLELVLSPAWKTFQDGYGHEADLAILYYAMLRELGYKPEFVFANGKLLPREWAEKVFRRVSPGMFSKILVRARMGGETVWFLDGGMYGQPGSCRYAGGWGLSEKGRLERIAVKPQFRNAVEDTVNISLHPNGNAEIRENLRYFGSNFARMQQRARENLQEETRRDELFRRVRYSLQASALEPERRDFDSYPGTIAMHLNVPQFATVQGEYLLCPFPAVPYVIFHPVRRCPLEYSPDDEGSVHCTQWILEPPEGYELTSLPSPIRLEQGDFLLEFSAEKLKSGGVRMILTRRQMPFYVLPQELPAFFRKQAELALLRKGRVIFRRTPAACNPDSVK